MSVTGRSISIQMVNQIPNSTLTFSQPFATTGPVPTASPASAGYGETITVTANNPTGGCVGGFTVAAGGGSFPLTYNHPEGPGKTTINVSPTAGYLAESSSCSDFEGRDLSTSFGLYQGLASNDQGGLVAPLDDDLSNAQDFINSLFGPNIREAAQVEAAYGEPAVGFGAAQMKSVVQGWTANWLSGGSITPAADGAILNLLKTYIQSGATAAGPLNLWLPQITYQGNGSPPTYLLNGYQQSPFLQGTTWVEDTVGTFLSLLVAGAHFVVITADQDQPQGVNVNSLLDVLNTSGLTTRHDPGSSHYATVTNITGEYYLAIDRDCAPPQSSFLLSWLFGSTVNEVKLPQGGYNVFFQLEGWPAFLGGKRHGADFNTYKQTLWNISTYGACPYSEKRATTIFLAPPGWTPQVYQTTLMMPYVGAYAKDPSNPKPQGWLNTSVVEIPSTAPPLPPQYFT